MPARLCRLLVVALMIGLCRSTVAQDAPFLVLDAPPVSGLATESDTSAGINSEAAELADPDPLAELRARIDQVEAQNNSLRSELQELKTAKPKSDPLSFSSRWNNGFEVQTADKKFRVHVGGRTQLDGVWIADTDNLAGAGGAGDGDAVDFRRARLRIDGTMYEFIDWAVEYDFVNSVNDNVGLQPASETNVVDVPAPTDLWSTLPRSRCSATSGSGT